MSSLDLALRRAQAHAAFRDEQDSLTAARAELAQLRAIAESARAVVSMLGPNGEVLYSTAEDWNEQSAQWARLVEALRCATAGSAPRSAPRTNEKGDA